MMNTMNDLPTQGIISGSQQNSPLPTPSGSSAVKEAEVLPRGEYPVLEMQKEIELPKEVVSIGVKTQPTVVNLPKSVSQMGVKQTGVNTQFGSGAGVTLPLTQPQITQGLEKSIVDSWRWLAVWCIRKLKQFRFLNSNKLSTNNESIRINE